MSDSLRSVVACRHTSDEKAFVGFYDWTNLECTGRIGEMETEITGIKVSADGKLAATLMYNAQSKSYILDLENKTK